MIKEESINNLPNLDGDYNVTEDQAARYRENGHILLREVAKAHELEAYRPIIKQWVKELNYQDKPLENRDTYGKAFIQIGQLWTKSQAIQKFVFARRFAQIAADLMGVDRVRLYNDQALFKEPGGGHTPWHQDQIYWPLDTDKTITLWMPLVPISQEIGSMSFASASHRAGYISKNVISDESHRTLHQYIDGKGFEIANYGAMAAGDVTFHSGWTIHSAPGNPSNMMREVMTIIYFADGARVIEPDSNAHRMDLASILTGHQPGDVVSGPSNPLVYARK